MSRIDGQSHEPDLPGGTATGGAGEIRPVRTARRRVYLVVALGLIAAGVILLAGLGWAHVSW